jgi:uncharacterized protein
MSGSVPIFNRTTTVSPWYRQPWPWLLMLGPAVVVVAGIHTVWLAFSQQDALVVGDYYKQGMAINQDLRRDRAAARMKMDAELRYDAVSGKLFGNVHSMGRPHGGNIRISLFHSTLPGKDIHLLAPVDSQGRFAVALPLLDMARWQVQIEGERADWRLNATWKWPQQHAVAFKADGAE